MAKGRLGEMLARMPVLVVTLRAALLGAALSGLEIVGPPAMTTMQLGMIGLGRMGGNMVRRLMRAGHQCVVYDVNTPAVKKLAGEGATGTDSLAAFVRALKPPRAVWLMVPAALVDAEITALKPLLASGDVVIDGGNSYYHDDIRRAGELKAKGIHYVDVGTSGGVFGLERGYCLMIGGEPEVVKRLDPIFATLAPGIDAAPRTAGRNHPREPPSGAISTAAPPAPATSSRWSTTASSTG